MALPPATFTRFSATPEGVDRAFKKLDTIKSEIVWWEAGAQAPQLLADGQVVMTSAWNGRLQGAIDNDKKPFKIVWDHQGLDWDWWAITKGTPKMEEAYRFIAFASGAEPQADADQVHCLWSCQQGCHSEHRSGNAAEPADRA